MVPPPTTLCRQRPQGVHHGYLPHPPSLLIPPFGPRPRRPHRCPGRDRQTASRPRFTAEVVHAPHPLRYILNLTSHPIAGSSAQEHRRFLSLIALDTRSPPPEPNYRRAGPIRHPRSMMFSPSRGISFPNETLPKTPQSRSSKMVPPEIHQVSELPSFLQTGRTNKPLTVRTMRKPSRTSSTISIPFQGRATAQYPIASVSSSSGNRTKSLHSPHQFTPSLGPTPSTWFPLSWHIMAS